MTTLFFIQIAGAQEVKMFNDENLLNFQSENLFITPNTYRALSLNEEVYASKTVNVPLENEILPKNSATKLSFPLPDGSEEEFSIVEYSMMEPGLAAAFPDIKTYHGVALKNPNHTIRFDYTSFGLRAVIRHESEMIYIDPVDKSNSGNYISYFKSDLADDNVHHCSVEESAEDILSEADEEAAAKSNSCGLHSYRLAVATTAEYSAFYSATNSSHASLVLSAVTTSINRVNEIFENDLGIRLILIDNMQNIFYYNSGTDPYSNNDPVAMLDENQSNLTSVIGAANYDVGHVVGTSPGGVAALNSPCNDTQKGRGVTGLWAPQGDAFDIDFLCHELGHQFGAYHTFNNYCNGNISTQASVEAGSGSTIMAYAGTCSPSVQNNTDAYFHTMSLLNISAFVNSSSGNSCAQLIASANNQPTANAGGAMTIPVSTPFFLTGEGTDPDGDVLTYCWEQMDKEITSQPPLTSATEGPSFRSFLPTTNPTRFIPNLTDLSNGGTSPNWEVLSSANRSYNFTLTVRDNSTNAAGCFAMDEKVVTTTNTAGPFIVTSPSSSGVSWTEGSRQTITWNVANTNLAPINCENVDILLSKDGGSTFPIELVKNVKNDGSAEVTIPAGTTSMGRIMVKSVESIFFNISSSNFSITSGSPDFYTRMPNPEQNICASDDAIYDVEVGSVSGFTENVLLTVTNAPAGTSVSFSNNPVMAGESTVLTLSGTGSTSFGNYVPTLNASPIDPNSVGVPKNMDFFINISVKPNSPIQVNPTNNEMDLPLTPTFNWNSALNADTYELQISTEPTFASLIQTHTINNTSLTLTEDLGSATEYYWRVRSRAECGGGDWSIPLRFTTHFCRTYMQETLTNLTDFGDTSSKIIIEDEGNIVSLEVENVVGSHSWVEDISAVLIAPDNTSVALWSNLCGSNNDFSLGFKDNAANPVASAGCAPLGLGDDFQPEGSLSSVASGIAGEWELRLNDNYPGDSGDLVRWGLTICVTDFSSADALPLDLVSFRATAEKESINLVWNTVDEVEVAGFEVERKTAGTNRFEVIDFVEGKGGLENAYFIDDYTAKKGITYQYRLRIMDISGSFSYSEIRAAKIASDEYVFNMFPNPAHDQLTVVLSEGDGETAILEAFNAAGQRTSLFNLTAGNNVLDISTMTSGIYLLKMTGGDFVGFQKLVVN